MEKIDLDRMKCRTLVLIDRAENSPWNNADCIMAKKMLGGILSDGDRGDLLPRKCDDETEPNHEGNYAHTPDNLHCDKRSVSSPPDPTHVAHDARGSEVGHVCDDCRTINH